MSVTLRDRRRSGTAEPDQAPEPIRVRLRVLENGVDLFAAADATRLEGSGCSTNCSADVAVRECALVASARVAVSLQRACTQYAFDRGEAQGSQQTTQRLSTSPAHEDRARQCAMGG